MCVLITVLVERVAWSRERSAIVRVTAADALQLATRLGQQLQQAISPMAEFRRAWLVDDWSGIEPMVGTARSILARDRGVELLAGVRADGAPAWVCPHGAGDELPANLLQDSVWSEALQRAGQMTSETLVLLPASGEEDLMVGLVTRLRPGVQSRMPPVPLVVMKVRLASAIDAAVSQDDRRDYDVRLVDGVQPVVHYEPRAAAAHYGVTVEQSVRVADRYWRLQLTPASATLSGRVTRWHHWVLGGGIPVSLLAGVVAWSAADARRRRELQRTQYLLALELLHQAVAGIGVRLGAGREVPDRLARSAQQLLRADAAGILILEESRRHLLVYAYAGEVPAHAARQLALERAPMCEQCMKTQEVVVEEDVPRSRLMKDDALAQQLASASLMLIPLQMEQMPVGLVALSFYRPRHFSRSERRLARMIGAETQMILANNHLYEQTRSTLAVQQHLLQQQEKLYEVAAAVYHAPSFQQSVRAIADRAPAILHVDGCSVLICEEFDRVLRVVASSGDGADEILGRRLPVPGSCAEEVLATGRMLVIEDAAGDGRPNGDIRRIRHIGSMAYLPLLSSNRKPLGLLTLIRHRPGTFPDEQRRLFQVFAERAAAAVENAMLQEQTRRDGQAKAVLLRELHHRVKNNLAGIVALLSMEQPEMSPSTRRWINRTIQRIETLARAHELFSERTDRVQLSTVIERIPTSLSVVMPHGVHLKHDFSGADVSLPTPKAVALAMVLHELCSNAIVHGLRDRGDLSIRAHRAGSEMAVEVSDNGRGCDPGVLQGEGGAGAGPTSGLGLRLVREIVGRELQGRVAVASEPGKGTTIGVLFPVDAIEEGRA